MTELLYISNGNIPSRWAHTIQTMKMSEAFARLVPDFALLIPSDIRGLFAGDRALFEWYGIRRPFRLMRLPMGLRLTPADLDRSNVRAFARLAHWFTRLRRPGAVITRCHESAQYALDDGLSVIFETHDGPGHPKTMGCIRRFAAYPNLRGVVTTSGVLKEAFCAEGIAEERVVVSPNGVDLDRFESAAPGRRDARLALGLDPHRQLAVYTGSLKAHKGVGTLLDAARLSPETAFLLVGGGEDQIAEWKARAEDAPNLRFVPFVANAELPRYLAAADVCLVPNSRSDRTAGWTFSLKLFEYLAARRAVVASAIPSLATIIRDGENGLLVPPDDPAALAEALRRLRAEPGLARRLAEKGRETASGHTWDRRAELVVERLLPRTARP